jgi:hypothetical protein
VATQNRDVTNKVPRGKTHKVSFEKSNYPTEISVSSKVCAIWDDGKKYILEP